MKLHWVQATAAAAAMVFAAAGSAQAQTVLSGTVSGHAAYTDLEAGGYDGDAASYGVAGAVAGPIASSPWGWQADGSFEYLDIDDADSDAEVWRGQAHIYWRDAERGAAGGHVGVIHEDEVLDDTLVGAGLEGEVYNGRWTVEVEGAYYEGDDSDLEVYGLGGGVAYYVTDDLVVSGAAAFGNVDFGGGYDSDYYEVSLRGERGFERAPVSVYAEVSYADVDDADISATQVMVGVTWDIGAGTIIERDRSGASRDGARNVIGAVIN